MCTTHHALFHCLVFRSKHTDHVHQHMWATLCQWTHSYGFNNMRPSWACWLCKTVWAPNWWDQFKDLFIFHLMILKQMPNNATFLVFIETLDKTGQIKDRIVTWVMFILFWLNRRRKRKLSDASVLAKVFIAAVREKVVDALFLTSSRDDITLWKTNATICNDWTTTLPLSCVTLLFPKYLNTYVRKHKRKQCDCSRTMRTSLNGLAVRSWCWAFCLLLTDVVVLINTGVASECEHWWEGNIHQKSTHIQYHSGIFIINGRRHFPCSGHGNHVRPGGKW